MRRVVSLWLPFWPIDRLRRHDAALPADAPLVTRAHDGHRMVIAAACSKSRGLGLRAGMPVAHAQAMVPELVVADAALADDAQALERLAAWCLRLSPLTAADPPDGVWIDVTGCAHLHGGEAPMLGLLVEHLERQGLRSQVAIADTPGPRTRWPGSAASRSRLSPAAARRMRWLRCRWRRCASTTGSLTVCAASGWS